MNTQTLNAFFDGHAINAYEVFGAHLAFEQTYGVRFSVFAPTAKKVQVIGSFDCWGGEGNQMEIVDERGVWSVFISGVKESDTYKYRITLADGKIVDALDPYSECGEYQSEKVSIVCDTEYKWTDKEWIRKRTRCFHQPLNICVININDWLTGEVQRMNYNDIATELIAYTKRMNYTHIEVSPLSNYGFHSDLSNLKEENFNLTTTYGTVQDLKYLVNELHKQNIGIIFDFSLNPIAFDSLMPEQQSMRDYDLNNEETRSFLISAAAYWLKEFHGDGLRMELGFESIYWQGKKELGINEGIATFIRRMNYLLHKNFNEVILISKDASDFSGVTKSTLEGGLGYDYKWNLGWQRAISSYFDFESDHKEERIPIDVFYQERCILPLFQEEIRREDGIIDNDEKLFLQIKLIYIFMLMLPGKKLSSVYKPGKAQSTKYSRYEKELHELYMSEQTLYEDNFEGVTFEWLNTDNSVFFSMIRANEKEELIGIFNLSATVYTQYALGVSHQGEYKEILNSEDNRYLERNNTMQALDKETNHKPYKIEFDIPAFSAIILKYERSVAKDYFE